jgi:hypothetical protein
MMSMTSGVPFTPIISFICSFFILSIIDFLADLRNTSISVDKILFVSLLGIGHTSAPYIKMLWIIVNSEINDQNFVVDGEKMPKEISMKFGTVGSNFNLSDQLHPFHIGTL